jgi:hypothetical protein
MTWIWIVVVAVFFVLLVASIFAIFAKTTAASHGGVEHPAGDKRRGNPPFESIDRHS